MGLFIFQRTLRSFGFALLLNLYAGFLKVDFGGFWPVSAVDNSRGTQGIGRMQIVPPASAHTLRVVFSSSLAEVLQMRPYWKSSSVTITRPSGISRWFAPFKNRSD
jgi:hypothetical protein